MHTGIIFVQEDTLNKPEANTNEENKTNWSILHSHERPWYRRASQWQRQMTLDYTKWDNRHRAAKLLPMTCISSSIFRDIIVPALVLNSLHCYNYKTDNKCWNELDYISIMQKENDWYQNDIWNENLCVQLPELPQQHIHHPREEYRYRNLGKRDER